MTEVSGDATRAGSASDRRDESGYSIDVAIPAFNARSHLPATLDSVLSQYLPRGARLAVLVTDDASSDGLGELLRDRYGDAVTLATHAINQGRSAACNTAIGLGSGNIVVVLDADCRFADDRMIERMLEHFDAGAEAVIGTVDADCGGFWGRYAGVVSRRRLASAAGNQPWHMTTANFAVRRDHLRALGGFSQSYRYYGFEDRDLLIRLHETGARVVVDGRIVVLHRAPATVDEVCEKLYQSGRHTAREFSARFPDIYARSRYGRLDLSARPRVARLAAPVLRASYRLSCLASNVLTRAAWVPFPMQSAALRASSALAYALGTCDAALNTGQAVSGSP